MNTKTLLIVSLSVLIVPVAGALDGLVHHWNFDEGPDWHDDPFAATCTVRVARDSIGTWEGTLTDMGAEAWVSGRAFTGLDFDGRRAFLRFEQDLSDALGGTATLSFWIRTRQAGSDDAERAPGVCGIHGKGIQWGWIDAQGRIVLSVDGIPLARTAQPIHDGTWHHVVLARDARTGEGFAYLDGRPAPVLPHRAPGQRSRGFSSIGRIEGGGFLAGRLDEIHIADRVIGAGDVLTLLDNHAPKLWPVRTVGTAGTPLQTDSILFKAYDPDRDPIRVVQVFPASRGSVKDLRDGSFLYTPKRGFTGKDAFDVTVSDGGGGFSRGRVDIEIQPPAPPARQLRTRQFKDLHDLQAGGAPMEHNGMRCPRAVDWDRDGDLDLLVGAQGGIWLYLNTGKPDQPIFGEGSRLQAGGKTIEGKGSIMLATADLTGDGVLDLIANDSTRRLRLYANTGGKGAWSLAESVVLAESNNTEFIAPDVRFDLADLNGDRLPDLLTGTGSGHMRFFPNLGATGRPFFSTASGRPWAEGSYNLYPRLIDLDRNGRPDIVYGVNWGSIRMWSDEGRTEPLEGEGEELLIREPDGREGLVRPRSDGAIVDFADFNGDGVLDLIMGGHAGKVIALAWGDRRSLGERVAAIEAVYASNPDRPGATLDANQQALLGAVRGHYAAILSDVRDAPIGQRQQAFDLLAAHIQRHGFLQMSRPLDPKTHRHLPSIAGQLLMVLHHLLPDHPTHRARVADIMALSGLARTIYLESGLHVGDNQRASRGQLESVRDLMRYHPRALFPDAAITLDHYFGDGRGGWFEVFTSAKNTFSSEAGGDVSEDARDLNDAIKAWYGEPVNRGDYFTFVMGHEVTHSLDGYVRSRSNRDLQRRWGLMLCRAAGPDILPQTNGWPDWSATRAHFAAKGFWDGAKGSWDAAWSAYWKTGPGRAWQSESFMRSNIDWFLHSPQESLATQANQYFAHSEARLIGAIDRYRRGQQTSRAPLLANLNEVALFMDFLSAGLNKMALYDTVGTKAPYPRAEYRMSHAWLVRDDRGRIEQIRSGDRIYGLTYDPDGVCTGVVSTLVRVVDDRVETAAGQSVSIDIRANDMRWEGGTAPLASLIPPGHGQVQGTREGSITYTPANGYTGPDRFGYRVDAGFGIIRTGQVEVVVRP